MVPSTSLAPRQQETPSPSATRGERPLSSLETVSAVATLPGSAVSLDSTASTQSANRGFNHSRSMSLNEGRPNSRSEVSVPDADSHMASSRGDGDLVRRHHTLSSSSRMVRGERSRVRAALPALGLSQDLADYYVPPSPIDGPAYGVGAWSDLGHGNVEALRAWTSHSRASSSSDASAYVPLSSSPSASSYSAEAVQPPSIAKRSSFVVLRGAKGDADLAERRSSLGQPLASVTPPRTGSLLSSSPPRPNLAHRNSLKPFLEADSESADQQEDWEKSLQDERDKEELELMREQQQHPYSTPPLAPSATFGGRTNSPSYQPQRRARSPGQQSIASVTSSDAWINGVATNDMTALRRHQSLNFRPDGDNDDAWPPHDRGVSEDLLHTLGGDAHSFASARNGAVRPASLKLVTSIDNTSPHSSRSHSNSNSSGRGGGNLSHSNSLSSHGHSSGALSPVGGFPRSPWSPTVEETKQLGMGAVGSPAQLDKLSREGSLSSHGSHHSGPSSRYGDEVARLSEGLANLGVSRQDSETPRKPPTPPGFEKSAEEEAVATSEPARIAPTRSMTANAGISPNRRLPPLLTSPDALASLSSASSSIQAGGMNAQSKAFVSRQGPASAAPYVPPIGHSHLPPLRADVTRSNFMAATAAPGAGAANWSLQKELLVGSGAAATSSVNSAAPLSASPFPTAVGVNPLGESWPVGGGFGVGLAMAQQQQIQLLQSQMQQAMQAMDMMKAQGHNVPSGFPLSATTPRASGAPPPGFSPPSAGITPTVALSSAAMAHSGSVDSPVDIPALVASKGYNPPNFDLRPQNARFFVIKSYTEEDVHKSLKYEIWASTDLGNKRLDRAFRESADKGPIYLFFSVNGSGHFAGMAQMLTPVDYAMSSNVWASDKWKGVLKVRWIYIKDVPLASLRHIRLSNTPENKPVTSSRDTQEVPYGAGLEVLKIISGFHSRTSLLQDFHWYEARTEAEKASGAAAPTTTPPQHYSRNAAPHPQPPHPTYAQQYAPPPLMPYGPPQAQGPQGRRFGGGAPMPIRGAGGY